MFGHSTCHIILILEMFRIQKGKEGSIWWTFTKTLKSDELAANIKK